MSINIPWLEILKAAYNDAQMTEETDIIVVSPQVTNSFIHISYLESISILLVAVRGRHRGHHVDHGSRVVEQLSHVAAS